MSDGSDNYFSDSEINDKKHEKLVENILRLNKVQNVKKPSRTEPSYKISEFNLVKPGNKGSVHVNELANVLKGSKKQGKIINKIQSTSGKSNTLLVPLEKPQQDRIRRTVNYEKARLQFDRWEALVTSNRAAAQIKFPLNSTEKLKIMDREAEKFPSMWKCKSELQLELEKLEPKVEVYNNKSQEKDEFPMTLKELKERRKEAAKLRAHQSFKEAKARRQNKIKSKKYHRILRKEKIKQKLKEFEELQKNDPEEALRKLEEIEKARAEERFSLRHKGTGQWAKNKQVRAKYDKESRQELAQQLAISRDLTRKQKLDNSESEDEGIDTEEKLKTKVDKSNPWLTNGGLKQSKDVTDFVSGYRKYWNEQNKANNGDLENKQEEESVEENEEPPLKKKDVIEEKIAVISLETDKLGSNGNLDVSPKTKENQLKKKLVKTEKTKKRKLKQPVADTSLSTSEWEVSLVPSDQKKKHKNNKKQIHEDLESIFNDLEDSLEKKIKQAVEEKQILSNNKNKKKLKQKFNTKQSLNANKKYKPDLKMNSKSKKHFIDEELQETHNSDENIPNNHDILKDLKKGLQVQNSKKELLVTKEKPTDIDPNKFVRVKQHNLKNAIPDISYTEDEENDECDNQRDIIMEAFEGDDIVEDFNKEKAEEVEKDTPKDIDLNLPGWGSWGGGNIKKTRIKKRFIIKMPKKMPRRDDNKGSVIINEKAMNKIKPHMVSEVPFPFRSVEDFEASIRAPISRTFVPETAFRKLIEPSVVTKMGTIIEPISKDILIGKKSY